jgi:prophage antirepressor-like protein
MGMHINPLLFEEQHLVRVVDHEGEPWFVAADICRVLEVKNVTDAVNRLDDDERTLVSNEGSSGPALNIVSEAGVYRLVFTSRKPVAERFKRWLAHEVIPAIRRDGFYSARKADGPQIPPAEQRPFPDWPMEELRTKKGVVDMYRMLYGVMAAQWVGPQMGFPPPPAELVEHGRQLNLVLTIPQAEAA